MIKISKPKLLFATAFLTLLLTCSTYAALTPTVHAAEVTALQRGLAISKNVLGIDTTKYNVTEKDYPPNLQASFLGVVPQETIIYNLTSDENNLSMLYTFAKGDVQLIQVLEDKSTQRFANPASGANTIAAQVNVLGAQVFLVNYQGYTGDSLYGSLKSTLNAVDASKNQTIASGNMKLEVTSLADGSTNFKWYYTANDAIAPYSKFIALGFKYGRFTDFVDNWHLYNVGSTNVNLSEQEAIAIALNAAKAYAYNMSLDAYGFQAKNMNESNVRWSSLIFDGSVGANMARSDDPLALYPDWRVGIALDKWYGEIYGIEVDVWADSGQVRLVQEAYSSLPPPGNASITNMNSQTLSSEVNPNVPVLVSFSVISLTMVGTTVVWMVQKKRSRSTSILKPFYQKTRAVLLCVLLSLSMLLACIGPVYATTRGAAVWGSESTGAYWNNPGDGSWRKTPTEISNQQSTAMYIAYYFSQNGYTGNPNISNIDHQGSASTPSQIFNDVLNLQSYNDYTAVVDFDHGVGGYPGQGGLLAPPYELHYMFEDNKGTISGTPSSHTYDWSQGIYDMEIYPWVSPGKVVFAFINTCCSADIVDFGGQGMLPSQWPPYPARAIGMPFAWTHRIVESPSTQGFTIAQDISNDGYNNPDWGYQVYIGFPWGSASLSQPLPYDSGYPYYNWVVSFFNYALNYGISVNQALDDASLQWLGYEFGESPLRTGFTAVWPIDNNNWYGYGSTMAVYGNGNIDLQQFTPPPDVASTPSVSGPMAGSHGVSYTFSAFATNPYAHSIQYKFDWGDGSYTQTGWYSDGQTASKSHTWSTGGLYSVRVQARTPNSGWSSWSNPFVINIDNQQVWLTVNAYDAYASVPLNPNVYVDGNYVGGAPVSMRVTGAYHTIAVDDPIWDPYWNCYASFSYMSDSNGNYGNDASVPVYSDTTITAWYWPSW